MPLLLSALRYTRRMRIIQSFRSPKRAICSLHQSKETMHFIDIAANLTDAVYSGHYNGTQRHDPDIPVILSRARAAGVVRNMVTAGTLSQSTEALALTQSDPSLFCTVGVHPTRASEMYPDLSAHADALLDLVKANPDKVVAIGECGLDYDRTQFCAQDLQIPAFIEQFRIAEQTQLPMFLHDRNTDGDFGRIISEHRSRFTTGVVHSFTGTLAEMQRYVNLDLCIGINGCSLKTEDNIQVATAVPLDRLMLETDCPYCEVRSTHAGSRFVKSKWPAKDKKKYTPDTMVKGRNEPCQIRQVCEVVASARGVQEEDVARAAFNNTMSMFFPKEAADMGTSPYDWSINAIARP